MALFQSDYFQMYMLVCQDIFLTLREDILLIANELYKGFRRQESPSYSVYAKGQFNLGHCFVAMGTSNSPSALFCFSHTTEVTNYPKPQAQSQCGQLPRLMWSGEHPPPPPTHTVRGGGDCPRPHGQCCTGPANSAIGPC